MRKETLGLLGIAVAILIAFVGWSRENNLRRKPLNSAPAKWNAPKRAHDVPLDNNSTTVRRGYRATFRGTPVKEPLSGAPVEVDRIVFGPGDRVGDFVWQKSISNIAIPANDSSTINAYIVDRKLAGTFLVGDLKIEFAAEENVQPVQYSQMFITVVGSSNQLPH